LKITEKTFIKIKKDSKFNENVDETRTSNSIKKKAKKNIVRKNPNQGKNHKFLKIYNILDDVLNNYKKDKEISKCLKNPMKNITSCVDILQKIGNEKHCVGILMCFKFFKSIIKKFIRISTRQSKGSTEKIAEKMDTLSNKIDYIEKFIVSEEKLKKN